MIKNCFKDWSQSKWMFNFLHAGQFYMRHVRIQRGGGGQGVRTPLKNHKNMGFLSNSGPDPLKITKLQSQHSMLGHHRPASETPFNGVSLAGVSLAGR